MDQNELKISAIYIKKLASYPDAEERISLYLDSLFANQTQQKDTFNAPDEKSSAVSSKLIFTQQEIKNMSTSFKKAFIANGLAAHVIKKQSGKNSFLYEIRYRANGYNIIASSTDLRKAKEKFLAKTMPNEIEKYRVTNLKANKDTFESIFNEWYMIKSGTITDKALQRFHVNFYNLPESRQKKPLKEVRTGDLNKVMQEVNDRKYEDLRTLFNGIFKYAIASGIITHNPVAMIKFKRAERESHEAFTKNEISTFFQKIQEPQYDRIRQASYILFFFGLRPCEIDEELRREGDFLIARNRKRKNGKIEFKKIPIPQESNSYIDWTQPLTFGVTAKIYYEWYKEIFGDKTPYSFRHTFCTVCQEFVRQEIVDIWMGDSPQRLIGKVYTHFSDEFMISQMSLVKFPLKT